MGVIITVSIHYFCYGNERLGWNVSWSKRTDFEFGLLAPVLSAFRTRQGRRAVPASLWHVLPDR